MLGLRNLSKYCCRVRALERLKVLHQCAPLSSSAVHKTHTLCATRTTPHSHLAHLPCGASCSNFQLPQSVLSSHRLFHSSNSCYAETQFGVVPAFADSISEGDIRWVKAVGDSVSLDEAVGEVETDKTTVPLNSPCNGVVAELLVEDGTTVSPGMKVFAVTPGAAGAAPPAKAAAATAPAVAAAAAPAVAAVAAAASAAVPTAAAPPPPPSTAPPTPAPPRAPLSSMPVAAIQHSSFIQQAQVKVPPSDYSSAISGTRTEQRVKMTRMRQRISARLKEAQNTCAMLTTINEVDMSNIMELRKSVNDQFVKRHGIKLGLMSAFVKGSAYALTKVPVVNAVIDGTEIVYRDYVDISVAVATPKGLVVPVIRNVEAMDYLDIEKAIAALGEKARHNAIAVEDMDGGTFTISNGGVFGSLLGTPIINPPQSAILGMHGIFDRPVVRGGQVVIRPMMYVALTYDHRLIDGREAVTFLRQIKTAVEDPRSMLCGL